MHPVNISASVTFDSSNELNDCFLFGILALSIIGVMSNLVSFTYIKNTFNVSQVLNFILVVDALVTTLSFGLSFSASVVFVWDKQVGHGPLGCGFMFFGCYFPSHFGPVSVALISVFRYLQTTRMKVRMWNRHFVLFSAMLMLLVTAYHVAFNVANGQLQLAAFKFVEACVYGDQSKDDPKYLVTFVLIPILVIVLVPAIFDGLTYKFIRNQVKVAPPKAKKNLGPQSCPKMEQIPLRATIMSTMIAIPYFAYGGVIGVFQGLTVQEKASMILFPSVVINTFRNPLIAICMFKVNEQNRKKSKEECNARRQMEIEDAIKRREAERATKNCVQLEIV